MYASGYDDEKGCDNDQNTIPRRFRSAVGSAFPNSKCYVTGLKSSTKVFFERLEMSTLLMVVFFQQEWFLCEFLFIEGGWHGILYFFAQRGWKSYKPEGVYRVTVTREELIQVVVVEV